MPLFEWCQWFEHTRIATESEWLFPLIEGSHILALPLSVGMIVIADLRRPMRRMRSARRSRLAESVRRLLWLSALVDLVFVLSCAKPKPEAEYRPTTTIRDLMDGMVDPAADTIWNSVSTTITKKGTEEKAPRTDEEWGTVRHGAIALVEASNLLQIPGRHVALPGQKNEQGIELQPDQIETLINQDRQAWITLAHGLHDAATQALHAADAKDAAKVLESGDAIDNACEQCHQRYWYPHPAQSPAK